MRKKVIISLICDKASPLALSAPLKNFLLTSVMLLPSGKFNLNDVRSLDLIRKEVTPEPNEPMDNTPDEQNQPISDSRHSKSPYENCELEPTPCPEEYKS
jgi:hypothetical protein